MAAVGPFNFVLNDYTIDVVHFNMEAETADGARRKKWMEKDVKNSSSSRERIMKVLLKHFHEFFTIF